MDGISTDEQWPSSVPHRETFMHLKLAITFPAQLETKMAFPAAVGVAIVLRIPNDSCGTQRLQQALRIDLNK